MSWAFSGGAVRVEKGCCVGAYACLKYIAFNSSVLLLFVSVVAAAIEMASVQSDDDNKVYISVYQCRVNSLASL